MKPPTIYDVYLLHTTGVPIFAGCSGSDYCKAHPGQHELHSGFFSAMHAFSRESFQDNRLDALFFDKLQVNFKIDVEHDLMLVFVHPRSEKNKAVKNQMDVALKLFVAEYSDAVSTTGQVMEERLEEYKQALRKRGILAPERMKNTRGMQLQPQTIGSRKYGFLRWFGQED